jgi:hypothetical protein
MKKMVVTLACVLIVPLAFAQTSSTGKGQKGQGAITTTEPITVTGTIISMTTEEGTAASYQPAKTLVVREDSSNKPGTYVIRGPGHASLPPSPAVAYLCLIRRCYTVFPKQTGKN